MPIVYERVDAAGHVVERVQPVPGDYEDTRLGVAVIDGANGWRIASQDSTTDIPAAEIESPQVTSAAEVDMAEDTPAEPVAPPAKARKET